MRADSSRGTALFDLKCTQVGSPKFHKSRRVRVKCGVMEGPWQTKRSKSYSNAHIMGAC